MDLMESIDDHADIIALTPYDDDDDNGRINFNVAYSPKTARTCNS